MKIEQNIESYRSKGGAYQLDNSLMQHYYPRRIIQILEGEGLNPLTQSALDLGIGHGYTTEFFSKMFETYTVLDGDINIINLFKENYSNINVNLIHSYFEDYDKDDKYDLIIAGFVMEHVIDPVGILSSFRNKLSSSGRMFIAVPNAYSMHRRLGKISGDILEITNLSQADIQFGHRRYYTVDTLTEDIEKAGMAVTRMEGLFLKPFMTSQILSLNLDEKYLNALCELGKDYPELCAGILAECS